MWVRYAAAAVVAAVRILLNPPQEMQNVNWSVMSRRCVESVDLTQSLDYITVILSPDRVTYVCNVISLWVVLITLTDHPTR